VSFFKIKLDLNLHSRHKLYMVNVPPISMKQFLKFRSSLNNSSIKFLTGIQYSVQRCKTHTFYGQSSIISCFEVPSTLRKGNSKTLVSL